MENNLFNVYNLNQSYKEPEPILFNLADLINNHQDSSQKKNNSDPNHNHQLLFLLKKKKTSIYIVPK